MLAMTGPDARVLMTVDSMGGVWRYALSAGEELVRRGAAVAIAGFGARPSEAQYREAWRAGVEVLWLDAELDWLAGDIECVRDAATLLDRLAREWSPSVLHLNSPALAAHLGSPAPRVVALHSCLATWWRAVKATPLPANWQWHANATRAGLAAADVSIAPSRAFARAVIAVYGLHQPLRVIANGSAGIAGGSKERLVLAAGRWWDEGKNFAAVDAAASEAPWPLHVAGPLSGPRGTSVEPAHAHWLGDLPHDELAAWFARAPIFISPALYEPFGLAVLEAASAGAALVLGDIPTFREIWDDCALFVEPRDSAALAEQIAFLASDREARARLAEAAGLRAGRYTVKRQVDSLLDAYAAAAACRARAA